MIGSMSREIYVLEAFNLKQNINVDIIIFNMMIMQFWLLG